MIYNVSKFHPPRYVENWLRPLCRFITRQMVNKVETYYDVLGVRKDCNNKEIHLAFVRLSKKFHPDTKGSKSSAEDTEKFVKISEAYQTLSKPKLRFAYDQKLWSARLEASIYKYAPKARSSMYGSKLKRKFESIKPEKRMHETLLKPENFKSTSKVLVPISRALWDSSEFVVKDYPQIWLSAAILHTFLLSDFEGRIGHNNKTWDVHPDINPNPGPYYGIKGLEKISNIKIVLVLLALAVFGGVFGYVSAEYSFNRQQVFEKSAKASSHHDSVRSDAKKYGNEEQLRRILDRMVKRDR